MFLRVASARVLGLSIKPGIDDRFWPKAEESQVEAQKCSCKEKPRRSGVRVPTSLVYSLKLIFFFTSWTYVLVGLVPRAA
jgi:hypothetical protein